MAELPPSRCILYSYDTGQALRELSADEWTLYQALLDSYTPAAKEHGVVEGHLFGVQGLVFARREGEDLPRQVVLSLSPIAHERLFALADANGISPQAVVEFLLMRHPRWAPVDPHAPFEPAGHHEVTP
jgi:hypothetical protein